MQQEIIINFSTIKGTFHISFFVISRFFFCSSYSEKHTCDNIIADSNKAFLFMFSGVAVMVVRKSELNHQLGENDELLFFFVQFGVTVSALHSITAWT